MSPWATIGSYSNCFFNVPNHDDLTILYRDEHFVAVHKPSGLLVHRSDIDRHATQFALQMARNQLGQRVYPVHRLDKPTSGILLFALHSEAARKIMPLFQTHAVNKTYTAVVRGYTEASGVIDHPLREDLDKIADRKVNKAKPAQAAITQYQCLQTVELPYPVGRYASSRYALLSITPRTGRKHQIRRHLKHIFHPIIGDTTHGDGRHNAFFRQQYGCDRLLLAATELSFVHPYLGTSIAIEAPLEGIFATIVQQLGWR